MLVEWQTQQINACRNGWQNKNTVPKFIKGLPLEILCYHISKTSSKGNRIILNPYKAFWFFSPQSHHASSCYNAFSSIEKIGLGTWTKSESVQLCKLNSRLFSHKSHLEWELGSSWQKNLFPAHHCYPIPVALVPGITLQSAQEGERKCLPWIYLLSRVLSLAFPHHFIWGFFKGGGKDHGVAGVRSMFILYTQMEIKELQEVFFKTPLIHVVRGKLDAIRMVFFPVFIMENYCRREGTLCAPNISRVCVAL